MFSLISNLYWTVTDMVLSFSLHSEAIQWAVRPDDVANTGTQAAEVKQHRAQFIPGWVTDCATVRSKVGRLVAIQTWGGVQSCL